ncbi:MAG: metal-dependent protease [Chlorobi bacterium OLB6]|nr:MAG: metal-dependent protease [Chlorobi bacterium OLB6]
MNHSPLPVILAIETSCDDTAAAVVQGTTVLSNIIASQTVHHDWGGIVPELASREHVRAISYCVDAALQKAAIPAEQIDAIAVTYGPVCPGHCWWGRSTQRDCQ